MKIQTRSALLGSVMVLAMQGSSAMAQLSSATNISGRGDVSAAGEDSLQDIIVTARKRSERLQDVPVAITAISGDVFSSRNAPNVKDIARVSPGVFYRSSDLAKPNLYIRGIGSRGFTGEADPSVGTFVDGVYIARSSAQVQDLDNVERVEVLKGPQGTLFGRNTIGGALNIVTVAPTNEFHARVRGSYGFNQEFGGRQFSIGAAVSGPLGENLRGLLSVNHSEADGPTKVINTGDLAGGGGRSTVRSRIDWSPTERLKFDLIGDYYQVNGADFAYRANDVGGLRSTTYATRPGLVALPVSRNPYLVYRGPTDAPARIHGGGGVLTTSYSAPAVDFTSISAYRSSFTYTGSDIDASPFFVLEQPYREKSHQISQEFRLASVQDGAMSMESRLDWTLGAFYFSENISQANLINFGPDFILVALPRPIGTGGVNINSSASARLKTRSYAFFGTAGFELTDSLKIEAGIRYTHDHKRDSLVNFTSAPGVYSTNFSVNLGKKWSSVDPSLTLSYKIFEGGLAYLNYSTGFKSGAFQVVPSNLLVASQIADPERMKAYQGGLKSELFDRRLRLNVAGFYYVYRDIQVQRSALAPGSTTQIVNSVTNGALSKLYGFEIEGQFIASENVRFDYGYSYLHARYSDYQFTPSISFSGNSLPRSPKHTANFTASIDFPTSLGKFTARGGGSYSTSFFFEPDNAGIGVREPTHFVSDASIDFVTGPYSVGVYARNLTGERQRNAILNLSPTRLLENWDYRRTIGVRASMIW